MRIALRQCRRRLDGAYPDPPGLRWRYGLANMSQTLTE